MYIYLFIFFSLFCSQLNAFCVGTGGFTGDTLVKVADGHREIRDIKVGDKVISIDSSGTLVEKEVTAVFMQRPGKFAGVRPGVIIPGRLCKIEVDDEVIQSSPEHRFLNILKQDWPEARYLPKDILFASLKGLLRLKRVERIQPKENVYNLSIKDTHIFFITKSDILVHNFAVTIPLLAWGTGKVAWISVSTLLTILSFFGLSILLEEGGYKIPGTISIDSTNNRPVYHISGTEFYEFRIRKHNNDDKGEEKVDDKESEKEDESKSGDSDKEEKKDKPPKSIDDILAETKPGDKTKGKSEQFEKDGGYDQAVEDFHSLGPTGIKDAINVIVGKLPDGRTVNVRPESSNKRKSPTLEVYNPVNKRSIKIRYN